MTEQDDFFANLTNTVGFVIDRTQSPSVVLGQATLISKARVATCASAIFNYENTPWALAIRFPYPDLIFSVKSITLHTDFPLDQARTHYLTQNGLVNQVQPSFANDIALLSIHTDMPEIPEDKSGDLKKVLTIPLPDTNVIQSGTAVGQELASIIQNIIASGQSGLLTFFDKLNLPIARLNIQAGNERVIDKAVFKSLTGELAVFELACRQPARNFVFQSSSNFIWPYVGNIETATTTVLQEASKRANELVEFIHTFGGPQARFIQAAPSYDPASVHPNARWIIERIWATLDGYVTINQLWEYIGVDTYTTLRALQEMLKLQIITPTKEPIFPRGQQLGNPLLPVPPNSLNVGDQMNGFYLDPLTGKATLLQGILQNLGNNNSLLHNIPFPNQTLGACVLKGEHIVGLNTGITASAPGEDKQYQMISIHTLSSLGIKRQKDTVRALDIVPEPVFEVSKKKSIFHKDEPALPASEEIDLKNLERIICPACKSVNLKSEICHNCKADLKTGFRSDEVSSWHRSLLSVKLADQMKTRRLIIIGAIIICLVGAFIGIAGEKGRSWIFGIAEQAHSTISAPIAQIIKPANVAEAKAIAVKYAGFSDIPPVTYSFEDTSSLTNGILSFGLKSSVQNQNIICYVSDSTAPIEDLRLVAAKVPFVNYKSYEEIHTLEKGQSTFGNILRLNWMVVRNTRLSDDKTEMLFLGAYKSPIAGKAIIIIARPVTGEIIDYNTTLLLIETMSQPLVNSERAQNSVNDQDNNNNNSVAIPKNNKAQDNKAPNNFPKQKTHQ